MSDSDTTTIAPPTAPDPTIAPPTPITPPVPGGGISGIDGSAPVPGKRLSNKDAEPYFLKEDSSIDRMKARPAAREIYSATPLIDGEAIFTDLETLIARAKSSVLLAFWGIEVSTRLLTDSGRSPFMAWRKRNLGLP